MRGRQDEIIWGNVERIRADKHWSYADLARAMSITDQAVQSLKNNGIGKRSLKKLSAALGCQQNDLLREFKESGRSADNMVNDSKGGDYTEILKRYIAHLEEENEKLKAENLRLSTKDHDRPKCAQT